MVRRELPRWGARNVCHKIVKGLWEALADSGGVAAQRCGALERVHPRMGDWWSLLARGVPGEGIVIEGIVACGK